MSRLRTTHPTGVEILHYSDHAGDAIVIIPPGVTEHGACVVTDCTSTPPNTENQERTP